MVGNEDRLLVLRAQSGDADAFAALVAARRAALLVAAAATIGDWDEAEDALQEALWRAFTSLRGLRSSAAFNTWLRRIVLNTARDHLRQAVSRIRREGEPLGDAMDLDRLRISEAGRTPEAGIAEREGCWDLLSAIASLPAVQRRAGQLTWVAGLPPSETAPLVGMSRDAVNAALHRARRHLGAMFYTKGDWRRDVEIVAEGTVRVSGYRDVAQVVEQLHQVRREIQAVYVDLHAEADVKMRLYWTEGPAHASAPPPAEEALPLDGLAEAAGLDLEPFGDRLVRFTADGRPYGLPHHDTPHLVLYNADFLRKAGLPLPRADWTWDDFFSYCERLALVGMHPINAYSPNCWDVGLIAEELGATRDNLEPVTHAVEFVRQWRTRGWTAPEPVPDWAFGQFLAGGCVFFMMQYGHPLNIPFPWGVAPFPRFHRYDPPTRYWFHFALQIPGASADPTVAFEVAKAILTDGPVPRGDNLPAYRTPEVMRGWLAQELPLGKECLLDLDAATGPLFTPPVHFPALPGAFEALEAMIEGQIPLDQGVQRLRDTVAAYRAGQRVTFRD